MTLNPPVIRASFAVPHSAWTRLPDDGFEIMHSGTGVQTIGAQPMMVQIRRLGPPVTMSPARGSKDVPAPEVWRPDEAAGRPCSYCEATDRVLRLARLFEEEDATTSADVLMRVAEQVSRRSSFGRRLAQAVLGINPEG